MMNFHKPEQGWFEVAPGGHGITLHSGQRRCQYEVGNFVGMESGRLGRTNFVRITKEKLERDYFEVKNV